MLGGGVIAATLIFFVAVAAAGSGGDLSGNRHVLYLGHGQTGKEAARK